MISQECKIAIKNANTFKELEDALLKHFQHNRLTVPSVLSKKIIKKVIDLDDLSSFAADYEAYLFIFTEDDYFVVSSRANWGDTSSLDTRETGLNYLVLSAIAENLGCKEKYDQLKDLAKKEEVLEKQRIKEAQEQKLYLELKKKYESEES